MRRSTRFIPSCSRLETKLALDASVGAAMPLAAFIPPPPPVDILPGPLIPEPVVPSGPTRDVPPPVEITGPPASVAPPDPNVIVTVQPLDLTLVPSVSAQQAAAAKALLDSAAAALQQSLYDYAVGQLTSGWLGGNP